MRRLLNICFITKSVLVYHRLFLLIPMVGIVLLKPGFWDARNLVKQTYIYICICVYLKTCAPKRLKPKKRSVITSFKKNPWGDVWKSLKQNRYSKLWRRFHSGAKQISRIEMIPWKPKTKMCLKPCLEGSFMPQATLVRATDVRNL